MDSALQLKRLYRFRLLDFLAAVFAGPPRIVIPKLEHSLAKMLDDIGTIEVNILHERSTVITVEDNMLLLSRWTAALDHHADGVWRPLRGVRDIWRDEERLTFAHDVIDNAVALANAHFDVALQLVEIFFRIDEMKIVSGVRAFDHHDKKIAAIVEIAVTHRWLEQMSVLFDPIIEINRWLHRRRGAAPR